MSESTSSAGYGLWELAVLCVLRERPMHPYEIQRLLKERHKHDILVLKRGSLYHAIKRLEDALLIKAGETSRNGRRPERTTYSITPAGESALIAWLRKRIAIPQREQSEFMGSLSFLVHLTPAEALEGLERRVELLQNEIAGLDQTIATLRPRIGRINVIEEEYLRALRAAELHWVRDLVADLRSGSLSWDIEVILQILRSIQPKKVEAI